MPGPHVTLEPDDVQYDTKVVAFLDVLGFKNLIREAKVATQAIDIICSLDRALRHSRPPASRPFGTLKMFSDCICVSDSPTPEGLHFVLWRCVVMQGLLLERGYLLRGAVTYGRHYESESMIFSEGLVDSYELEHSAIYPRVIVSAEVARGARAATPTGLLRSPARDLMLEDQDGMLFLDYFRYMELLSDIQAQRPAPYESRDLSHTDEEALTPAEFLECHERVVEKGLRQYADAPYLLQKYAWMAHFERRPDRFQAPNQVRTRTIFGSWPHEP